MSPPKRQRLMRGEHSRLLEPSEGQIYAFLIDVAGEDEGAADIISDLEKNMLRNPARNSTALTIVEVDRSTVADQLIKAPTYKVVDRRSWLGVSHTAIYGEIRALAD